MTKWITSNCVVPRGQLPPCFRTTSGLLTPFLSLLLAYCSWNPWGTAVPWPSRCEAAKETSPVLGEGLRGWVRKSDYSSKGATLWDTCQHIMVFAYIVLSCIFINKLYCFGTSLGLQKNLVKSTERSHIPVTLSLLTVFPIINILYFCSTFVTCYESILAHSY